LGRREHSFHEFGVIVVILLHFPDFGVPHNVDDLELANQVVNPEFDGFNAQEVLQFLDIGSLIDHLHDVLGSLLVIDSEDAVLGESDGKLLHYVVTCFHDFCSGERLHIEERIS